MGDRVSIRLNTVHIHASTEQISEVKGRGCVGRPAAAATRVTVEGPAAGLPTQPRSSSLRIFAEKKNRERAWHARGGWFGWGSGRLLSYCSSTGESGYCRC